MGVRGRILLRSMRPVGNPNASLAYRRPHGPQNGDGKKNQQSQELLAHHMVAQPSEPHGRRPGIISDFDHPRNEPESVRGGKREHCSKKCKLPEKDLPVRCLEQIGNRADQEPAIDEARDDECGHRHVAHA